MQRLSIALWNADERRLRALWRQVLALALYVGLLTIAGSMRGLSQSGLPGPTARWLALPLWQLPPALGALLGIWLLARFVNREPLSAFGLRLNGAWFADCGCGLALGVLLAGSVLLVEWLLGWVTVTGTLHSGVPPLPYAVAVLSPLLLVAFAAVFGDLMLRAYPIRNLSQGMRDWAFGPRGALILAWALTIGPVVANFLIQGQARGAHRTALTPLNSALAAVMLGLGYVLTGRLGLTMGLHLGWDFSQGSVFGFPVAGLDTASTASLFVVTQGQDNLWAGLRSFGPTGGLLVTFLFLTGILVQVLYVRMRYGPVRLRTELARHEMAHEEAADRRRPRAEASQPQLGARPSSSSVKAR
jgi:CAAX protease family protein